MKTAYVVGGASVISFAAGAAAGVLVARKYLDQHYSEMAGKEIVEAKRFYRNLHKKEFETPQDAVAALINDEEDRQQEEDAAVVEAVAALRVYQGTSEVAEGEEGEVEEDHEPLVPTNIFERPSFPEEIIPGEDPSDPNTPYIISRDECFQNEMGYEELTLTYFEGDGVLINEQEEPVEDISKIVGKANLTKFGEKSGDDNVVYIRNDRIMIVAEVLRSQGKYSKEVLGFDDESPPSGEGP